MKNKVMLNDLLTWSEIFNFCLDKFSFGINIIKKSSDKKSQTDQIDLHVNQLIYDSIHKRFPDFPFSNDCFEYRFYITKDANNQSTLYLDKNNFIYNLLSSSANYLLDENKVKSSLLQEEDVKSYVINELKKSKSVINEQLAQIQDKRFAFGFNQDYKIVTSKEEFRETLLAKRKMVVWAIKNFDSLYSFLQEPIDMSVFDMINKDKFLLIMTSFALSESGILSDKKDIDINALEAVNNYILLVKFLNKESDNSYYINFSSELNNGKQLIVSVDTVIDEYNKYYCKNKELIDSYNFANSYEDLLADKANIAWNKMKNERLAQQIRLNWEMIPSGKNISLANYSFNSKRVINPEKRGVKLQKAYDLLDKKIEYFSGTNPLFELTGINTFEGYSAYLYSNGVVVFEKFFKDVKGKKGKNTHMLVPVSDEAIYVMNFKAFADLSKYTKLELVQEISTFHNPNVKRILHTTNGSWMKKVTKHITGAGYGELDLSQIDVLATELSKQKVKTIDE